MKITKLIFVFAYIIYAFHLSAVQRMGLSKGSTGVIPPKGSGTLWSRCLDEHDSAPDTETYYTKILSNNPYDIVVKIGNNPPIALEQAILEKKVTVTGYTGVRGDSSSLDYVGWVIEQMRVNNLTTHPIAVTVKRFTPIGTNNHSPFVYDLGQFSNLSQKALWESQIKYKDKQAEFENQYWKEQQHNYDEKIVIVGNEQIARLSDNMLFLPGGNFQMEKTIDVLDRERAGGTVILDSFYLCKHEVTQPMWIAIMGINPSVHKALSYSLPVENVSWYECVEFCNKLSIQEGLIPCYNGNGDGITCDFKANGYRLPTEAEWEYAARGGDNGKVYIYSGSNDLNLISWRDVQTHDVMSKDANVFGIFDMSGNLQELCWDAIYSDLYRCTCRILRGGSFAVGSNYCKTQSFGSIKPDARYFNVGFRLCRSAE